MDYISELLASRDPSTPLLVCSGEIEDLQKRGVHIVAKGYYWSGKFKKTFSYLMVERSLDLLELAMGADQELKKAVAYLQGKPLDFVINTKNHNHGYIKVFTLRQNE